MQTYAVVVAGGTGQRMGAALPKQFLLLHEKPILQHTLERIRRIDPQTQIILALPTEYFDLWHQLQQQYACVVPHRLVAGGSTRFHTVQNALQQVQAPALVAVHDAVRPLFGRQTWLQAFATARRYGAAVPVIELVDSVRQLTPQGSQVADRSVFRLVQTPQVFDAARLLLAYQQSFQASFTDDASVYESLGHSVHLVEGNPENIKITRPIDLILAHTLWPMIDGDDQP